MLIMAGLNPIIPLALQDIKNPENEFWVLQSAK
jgi:hypothetical protein